MRVGVATIGIALVLAGCVEPEPYVDPRPRVTGELGSGRFAWSCVSDLDPFCAGPSFPEAVVVGGHFGLEYRRVETDDDDDDPTTDPWNDGAPLRLERVSAYTTGVSGNHWVANVPGHLGFVVRDGAGAIVDLLHLEAVAPTGLSVSVDDATTVRSDGFQGGAGTVLAAEVRAISEVVGLAGAVDGTFASADERVLQARWTELGRSELTFVGAGETVLTVTVGSLAREYAVRVVETGDPEGTASDTTGTSDGEGTDTDTGG